MIKLLTKIGITLLELLIAISILVMIGVGAMGLHIASRRALASAARLAGVHDEARHAMEHMVRNIRLGNLIDSDANSATPLTPLPFNTNEIHVRMDWNPTTSPSSPINSPANFDDDYEVWYRYDSNQIQVNYRSPPWTAPGPGAWSGWVPIAAGIVDPTVLSSPIFTIENDPASPIFLTIDLTAAHDASTYDPTSVDPDNPGVTLQAGVNLRCRARD